MLGSCLRKVGERSLPWFLAREEVLEGCWEGTLLKNIGVKFLVTRSPPNVISLWFPRGK